MPDMTKLYLFCKSLFPEKSELPEFIIENLHDQKALRPEGPVLPTEDNKFSKESMSTSRLRHDMPSKGIKTRLTVSSCTQVEDTTKMCIQYARCISSHKIWLPCQKFVSRFDQATMTKREYGKNWCRLFKRLLCSTKIKSSLHHDREKSRPYKPLLAKMLSGHPQL